jgi:RsiW-degrading membrane proteinase PrsW (M82 family)
MLKGMLEDSHNKSLSSKRVVTFLAFVLCGVAFMANLFWDYRVEPYMFEGMVYIAMAGLGFTASEKFASINKKTENDS